MCPIYDKTSLKNNKHLEDISEDNTGVMLEKDPYYTSALHNIAKNDLHYRFHPLTVELKGKNVIENAIIDFKHCFSVPTIHLLDNRQNRILALDSLFAEQITLKFSVYLSRVAIPDLR